MPAWTGAAESPLLIKSGSPLFSAEEKRAVEVRAGELEHGV